MVFMLIKKKIAVVTWIYHPFRQLCLSLHISKAYPEDGWCVYFLLSLLPWMYVQGDVTIQLLSSLTEWMFSVWNYRPVSRMDVADSFLILHWCSVCSMIMSLKSSSRIENWQKKLLWNHNQQIDKNNWNHKKLNIKTKRQNKQQLDKHWRFRFASTTCKYQPWAALRVSNFYRVVKTKCSGKLKTDWKSYSEIIREWIEDSSESKEMHA